MSRRRGEIITFYSFKGGVGRSVAVANVAAVLAQHGKSVLVLDFDFEAPGLHRYFLREPDAKTKTKRFEPDRVQRGVINLFKALRKRLRERLPLETHDLETPTSQQELRAIVGEVLGSPAYRYRINIRNPNRKKGSAALDFIAAGRFDEGYAERIRSFGWKRFYSEYAEVFPILADELAKRYDYVLIDSRTGFTDIGSICTMVLPDKLVLVFSPNEQSVAGALDVGEQTARERASTGNRDPLPLFPLLSRLEDSEEVFKRQWVRRVTDGFEKLFKDVYRLKRCDLEGYFDLARVPHRAYYAYGERIAAEEEKQSVAGSMAQGFKLFADCLSYEHAYEVRPLPKEQAAEAERAVLAKLEDEPSLREMIERTPGDAMLRLRLADLLRTKGRAPEAITVYDEIVSRFSGSKETELQEQVASALIAKALSLAALNRREQELVTYDDVVRRFRDAEQGSLRALVAQALSLKADVYYGTRQLSEAIHTLDELLRHFADSTEPVPREQVASALMNKGVALGELKQTEEAVAVYDEVVRRFGDATEPTLRERVARALNGIAFDSLSRAKRVWQQGDQAGATQILLEADVRILAARERNAQDLSILGNAGYIAFLLGRPDEARAFLTEAIQRGGEAARQSELADADIYPLPQDEDFRALVRSL